MTQQRSFVQELKNYNVHNNLRIGYWLDVLDDSRVWRVAKIISVMKDSTKLYLNVRLDGYSTRYNEKYKLPSDKLAPFRSRTQPYTGESRKADRDDFSAPQIPIVEQLRQQREKLDKFIKNPVLQCEQITQYLRGQLYVFVDSLLCSTRLRTNECEQVFKFLQYYAKQAVIIIKKGLQFLPELVEYTKDPLLYLVVPKYAYHMAASELLDSLCNMLKSNSYSSRHKFYAHNEEPLGDKEDAIIKRMKSLLKEYEIQQLCALMNKNTICWAVRKRVLLLLHLIDLTPEFPTMELKDFNEAFDIFSFLGAVFPMELVQNKQLNYIFDLITSGSFERKLKGINELKQLLERRYQQQKLLTTMKQRNILEFLIDANAFNSELFKRSLPIIEFFVKQKSLKNEHLDRIVALTYNRHESENRLIYGVIADLAKSIPVMQIDYLYSKILEFKPDAILPILLKDFTINAIRSLNYGTNQSGFSKKSKASEKYEYYGLPYLFELLQDQSPLEVQDIIIVSDAFIQIMDSFRHQRQKYFSLSLKKIEKCQSVAQNFKIIEGIIKRSNFSIVSQIVVRLDKQYPIVELMTTSLTKIMGSKSYKLKLPLAQTIQNYFNLLDQISRILKKSLNSNYVKQFWQMEDKTPLLNFLKKERQEVNNKEGSKFYEKRIDNAFIKDLFDEIFLVPELMNNYENLDLELVKTIDELFLTYQIRTKNINFNNKNTIKVVKNQNIDRLFYLRVLMNRNTQKVEEFVSKRLVDLSARTMLGAKPNTDINAKILLWTNFIQRITNQMSKGPASFLPLLRTMRIFLEQIEGRTKSINIQSTAPTDLIVQVKPDKVKTLTLPRCSTLFRLRQAIAAQFGLGNSDFTMMLPQNDNHITEFEFEEDYSLAVITTEAQGPSVVVIPSKETHVHARALDKFRENMSDTKVQFLYELLDRVSEEQLEVLVEITNKLPRFRSLQRKILKLECQENNWNQLLSSTSIRKLNYQLNILTNYKDPKWVIQFITRKGLDHLLNNIYLKIDQTCLRNAFSLKCYSSLLALLYQYISFGKTTLISKMELLFMHTIKVLLMSIEKPISETVDFALSCFKILILLISFNGKLMRLLFQHKRIQAILRFCIFTDNKGFCNVFFSGIQKELDLDNNKQMVLLVLITHFLNLKFLDTHRKNCDTFFAILIKILDTFSKNQWRDMVQSKNNLIMEMIQFLRGARKMQHLESSAMDFDSFLNGWLLLIDLFIRKSNLTVQQILDERESSFANYLLSQCLFPAKDKSESAKCKSNANRTQTFNILSLMEETKEYCLQEISKLLIPILKKSNWRRSSEWAIAVHIEKPHQFKGLKNLAATCYINSLMQQLFHISEFRQALLRVTPEEQPNQECTLFEVQQIFSFLKYSQRAIYTPKSFCNSFIVDGHPIDPRMQMDADQFFNTLMDKLERNLKAVKAQHVINNVFQGELSNQLICKDCPHESERNEDFLSLGLTIKNKNSVDLALKEFIKGEMLDGDNAYYCEKCEKKVKCLKRACIKQLPNVLMIVLKRFEFDFDLMQKIKLNDYCEFPLDLDMKPYTKEYLQNLETGEEKMRPDAYYQYSLKGTVIHYGTSEAGHYYSYIKTTNGSWYEFNDEMVDKFDLSQLKNEAFGGELQSQFIENEEKIKNAYILFYERNKTYINGEQSKIVIPTTIHSNRAYEIVHEDNLKNEYIRVAFDQNLIKFIQNKNNSNQNQFLMLYTHLVVFRSKDRKQYLADYYRIAEKSLKQEQALCIWYINNIDENFIRQFLIDAPKQVKYVVLSLIIIAIKYVKPNVEFFKRCLKCLSRKSMTPFAKLFHAMLQNKEYHKFFTDHEYIERVLRLFDTDSPHPKPIQCAAIKSDFGQCLQTDELRKEEICYVALIQSIEIFSLKFEDLKRLISRGVASRSSRNSLAKLIARAMKTRETFDKWTMGYLAPQLIKQEDEKQLLLCIGVMKELISINDDQTADRHKRLAEIHLSAMKEAINTYIPFTIMLEGLFKLCFGNVGYRSKIIASLEQNKSLFKSFKYWIADLNNLVANLKSEKITLNRKPLFNTTIYNHTMMLTSNQTNLQRRKEEITSKLNALMQKHNVTSVEVDEMESVKGDKLQNINYFGKLQTVEILERIGMISYIRTDAGERWHSADDDLWGN